MNKGASEGVNESVNESVRDGMDLTFHDVIAQADLPADTKSTARIGGWHILLCNVEGTVHAVNDRCPHAASPLSDGRVRRGIVMCPLHGARFEIATGTCIGGAFPPLHRFPVRIENGRIAVAVPKTPPGMDKTPVRPC